MAQKLVIFGNQKTAQLAHFYFLHDSPWEVVAFTVDDKFIKEKVFVGLPVIPFETVHEQYPGDDFCMFVAVGYAGLNKVRSDKYLQAKEKGYRFTSYLSSKATWWGDTKIGENCFILENQVIQPVVTIGNNVFIWSGNHFGHDVVISDHCWISSHVVVSGGVSIGSRSFIGVNAAIRDGVRIGSQCIIGAGTTILRDVQDREVYVAKTTERYPLDSERFERMMDISR